MVMGRGIEWAGRTVKVADLRPYEANPRTIGAEAYNRLKKSITEDGYHQRIICTQDLRVMGGHQRIKALTELGIEEIEVLTPDREITDEQFKRILIRDNIEAGEWDLEALGGLMSVGELVELGVQEDLFPKVEKKGLVDEDEAPESPANPVSSPGDVWLCGAHRVMCGNSTSAEQLGTLMDGSIADLVFTDPPYGNNLGYGRGQLGERHIMGDEDCSVLQGFVGPAASHLRNNAHFLAFTQWRTFSPLEKAFIDAGLKLRTVVVWDKKNAGLSGGGFAEQHELLFIGIKGKAKQNHYSGNVWTVSRENKNRVDSPHPHQKPIELLEQGIRMCLTGDVVLDCFGGSGSTLIACENLGHKAHLMELDPKYVDVIVKRWQAFTGQQARLESTGETFAERKAA